jgi:type VI protein secretion system component VasF
MTMAPASPTSDPRRRPRKRMVVAVVVIVLALLALVALAAAWILFFGTPAPAAPTLDDALRVLLPSAAPGG